ncbi:MAG: glycosyltransferase [Bacteroidaceae bacterium]|nr:glycosyltransferase [Bacteroidaceae bacterium]
MLNTTSIIIIIASVGAALLLPLCSAYFRRLKKPRKYIGAEGVKMPPLSVIVSAFDDPEGVLMKMNAYLTQEYDAEYEVVLVVDNEKVKEEGYQYQLDQLPNKERLRVTYVPDSSHYMGLQKLAATLGVKAAKNEWIVLTDAHTQPLSNKWLAVMARNCAGKDIVLGYTMVATEKFIVNGQGTINRAAPYTYADAREQRFDDFQRFERMLWQLYNLRQAERGTAYSTAGGNIMFRKSMFMRGKGFSGNLKYTFGEYEFLVNSYATRDNVAVETNPDAWCERTKYTAHEFDLYHRCFQETRKHLLRRWSHRLTVGLDQAVLHLSFPFFFALIVWALCTSRWIPALTAAVCFAAGLAAREYLAKKSLKRFRIKLKSRIITHFELYLLWQHVIYYFKYLAADKTEFISHKY